MAGPPQAVEPETAAPPVVSFKKRGARLKENIRKRPAPSEPTTASSRDDGSDEHSSSDDDSRQGRAVKRRPQNTAVVTAASTSGGGKPSTRPEELFPTSSQAANNDKKASLVATTKDDATKTRNWFDEDTKAKVGPTRASASNVRMTTLTDFAPDVCKDYKKTGYCGFGQNCVFLHDRGDYKQGWELDREWENVSKGKNNLAGTVVASARRQGKAGEGDRDGDEDEEEEEDPMLKNIPFACIICEQPYKYPVVTTCGHYFCEACALKRYRKDPGCAACGAGTHGVFNSASRLKKLLQQKRERMEKKRQAVIEAGEQVSDEDADAEQKGGTAEV